MTVFACLRLWAMPNQFNQAIYTNKYNYWWMTIFASKGWNFSSWVQSHRNCMPMWVVLNKNTGCVLVAQLCPTLCDPMYCSPPGSSVHGIFQARILEWVAISFSRGYFQPRNQTQASCIAGRFFTYWAMREAFWIKGTYLDKATLLQKKPSKSVKLS